MRSHENPDENERYGSPNIRFVTYNKKQNLTLTQGDKMKTKMQNLYITN